jgi:hypothetical protein
VRGSDPVALGVEAELPDRRKLVVHHPERHFSTVNYCIAKGSFDHLVGEQLHAPSGEPKQQPCCCCNAGARASFLTLFVNGDLSPLQIERLLGEV